MKKFIIPDKQFVMSATAKYIGERQIYDAVMSNNKRCSIYYDYEKMGLVAYCENKPRDLSIYGLKWSDIEL